MNFTSPTVNIKLTRSETSSNRCLLFEFRNKFKKEVAIPSAQSWSAFFEKNPNEHFDFIWDCSEMSGFEIGARTEWYHAIKDHKLRISHVTVIADSIMIRSAAKVMLQYFKIRSVITRTKEKVLV